MEIQMKEQKWIERLIYSFVNGLKSQYGPEKMARKYLKGPKSKGGIASIDVKTFVGSIVLKLWKIKLRSTGHPVLSNY